MRTTSRSHLWLSALILLLGAGWIWASKAPPGSLEPGIPAPRPDFKAPDFSLTNTNGELVQLSSLRGRPVLLNFWASWCPPCRAEMPAMQRLSEEYAGQGLVILAVNATSLDDIQAATRFVEEYGLTFPILWDTTGSASSLYRATSLPTSFFIAPDGVIQEMVIGGMAEAQLRIRVEELLASTSATPGD